MTNKLLSMRCEVCDHMVDEHLTITTQAEFTIGKCKTCKCKDFIHNRTESDFNLLFTNMVMDVVSQNPDLIKPTKIPRSTENKA